MDRMIGIRNGDDQVLSLSFIERDGRLVCQISKAFVGSWLEVSTVRMDDRRENEIPCQDIRMKVYPPLPDMYPPSETYSDRKIMYSFFFIQLIPDSLCLVREEILVLCSVSIYEKPPFADRN
jgi:hypothetical protein